MTEAVPIPDVREELERKTLDELVRLTHCVQEGRLEEGEFSLIAKSMWAITSGLVPIESAELIAQAADEYPAPIRKAHFLNKDGTAYTFAWNPEKDNYVLVKRAPGVKAASHSVKAEREQRVATFDKVFANLLQAGWVRL